MVELPGVAVTIQAPEFGKPLRSTLPVAVIQVGCVIVPAIGAAGVKGCASITAFVETADTQPDEFVTVKVYVIFSAKPLKLPVVTGPEPEIVDPPGAAVTVHVPEFGKPLKSTLPVAIEQVGCVIAPTTGAEGVEGCALITAFKEDTDTHPEAFITVNVYVVFSVKPLKTPVVTGPEPVTVEPPGVAVTVHAPEFGKPLKSTLPVATEHVG